MIPSRSLHQVPVEVVTFRDAGRTEDTHEVVVILSVDYGVIEQLKEVLTRRGPGAEVFLVAPVANPPEASPPEEEEEDENGPPPLGWAGGTGF